MRIFLVGALLLLGCANKPSPAPPRDSTAERRHDSIIGASSLPGAAGVRGALRAADSAAARRARENAASSGQ